MLRSCLSAIVLSVIVPISAFAAPPSITGISAELKPSGEVRISWDVSPDPTVKNYRIYYSSESILESGGIYDDFEETQGTENVYIFVKPPKQAALYVTVLAVNAAGEESEAFVEETHVDLSASTTPAPRLEQASSASAGAVPPSSAHGGQSSATFVPPPVLTLPSASSSVATASSAAPIPTYTAPVNDGRAHLLLAEALSPIQVKLTMSVPVTVDPQKAPTAFRIEREDGTPLRITQLLLSDTVVVIDTEQQTKDVSYTVRLSDPLTGEKGEPLDPTDRTATFLGHPQGSDASVVSSPLPSTPGTYDPMHPADVQGFQVEATPDGKGTYSVTAKWQADISRGDIAYYAVRQTLDNGATYSDPQKIPMDVGGFTMQGAQPGTLGILLQVVNIYGGISTGVKEVVTLGTGVSPQAQVRPPETLPVIRAPAQTDTIPPVRLPPREQVVPIHGKRLSQTGMGLFVIGSSMIGSYVGWRRGKKG